MRFDTATDLTNLLDQSALSMLLDEAVETDGQGNPVKYNGVEQRQRLMLWEEGSGNDLRANRWWQPYYILADGSARLGPKIQPPLAEFLKLRDEIDNHTGTVDEIVASIEAKTVKRGRGERVFWPSIHVAIGVGRGVSVRGQLEASGNAAAAEIARLLDPTTSPAVGADPAVDEWDRQVDAMAALADLTATEITKIKAIGDVPWTQTAGVAVRRWQVERLVS